MFALCIYAFFTPKWLSIYWILLKQSSIHMRFHVHFINYILYIPLIYFLNQPPWFAVKNLFRDWSDFWTVPYRKSRKKERKTSACKIFYNIGWPLPNIIINIQLFSNFDTCLYTFLFRLNAHLHNMYSINNQWNGTININVHNSQWTVFYS